MNNIFTRRYLIENVVALSNQADPLKTEISKSAPEYRVMAMAKQQQEYITYGANPLETAISKLAPERLDMAMAKLRREDINYEAERLKFASERDNAV